MDDFGGWINVAYAKHGGHVLSGSSFKVVAAIVCVTAVLRLCRGILQSLDHDWERHLVWLTNAHVDQVDVWLRFFSCLLGALDLLKLIDGSGFAVLIAADALSEEFLDI